MLSGMRPVRLAVLGAGSRGRAYGTWVLAHPDRARVVAVADPDPDRVQRYAAAHDAAAYGDWRELMDARPDVDAVVIATLDSLHVEPALAAAAQGRHILLEKPIAPT